MRIRITCCCNLFNKKWKRNLSLACPWRQDYKIDSKIGSYLYEILAPSFAETGDDKEAENDELLEREREKQKQDDKQQKEKEKQQQLKYFSPYTRSFQMFKDRKPLEDVAIELQLDTDTVVFYYEDYLRLLKMDWLFRIYNDFEKRFSCIFYLYKRIKKEGLNKHDIKVLVKNQQ